MFIAIAGEYALPPGPGRRLLQWRSRGYQIFLSAPIRLLPATWLERPEIDDPIENCEQSVFGGARSVEHRTSARSISRFPARCCPKTPRVRRTPS